MARTGTPPGTPIGLTAPVTYDDEHLARLLERSVPSVALPNLLTYVPCIKQPRVAGVTQVPKTIVGLSNSLWPLTTDTSPFEGVAHLYDVVRLSLADSEDPPGDVAVYVVDRRIAGAAVAPPTVAAAG